ncbi:MAG TPA: serine hydrolase domain-containing protein [Candidatus Tumulicola sp.]
MFAALLAFVSTNTLFPAAIAARLDRDIAAVVRSHNLPSVALEVDVPKRGRYMFVDGYANLTTKTPRTLAQPFRIASITKPYAATAILVLVDRGLLEKSDTVSKWYPDFPYASRITIDDLLRMRSGIPAPSDDEVLAQVYDAPLAPAPPLSDELASYARRKNKFVAPNTIGEYANFNYDILSGIVHKVTGKDIGQLITETVIQPLRLNATSYPTGTGISGPLRGYGWNPKTKRFDDKTAFNPPLAGAAGAVIADIPDLIAFSRALCVGGLLKPATQSERLQGQPLQGAHTDYGEGVAVGSGACGHSGTINGFSTDMYYVAASDASFVVSVNRLDRDNQSQTTPILALIGQAVKDLPRRQAP